MEILAKTKVEVGADTVRLALDYHGRCWILGRDLGDLIGQRYPHIPKSMRCAIGDKPVAHYSLLGHMVRKGHLMTPVIQQLGQQILSKGIGQMCDKAYGARQIERTIIDQLIDPESHTADLSEFIRQLPGDHHVYHSLVRQAFGATGIQLDSGPFAPHPKVVPSLFTIDKAAKTRVTSMGVASILQLLGVTV